MTNLPPTDSERIEKLEAVVEMQAKSIELLIGVIKEHGDNLALITDRLQRS